MQDRIAELLASRRSYQDKIKSLASEYRYVVFYGCGAIYSSIVDTWNEYVGRPIDFCCDSDPAKWGQRFRGAECLSPQALQDIKQDCAVFVTIGVFQPVFEALRTAGFPSVNLLYKYDLLASAYLDEADDNTVGRRLRQARGEFTDSRSLEVFDAILERALGGSEAIGLMPSICEPNQYFQANVVPLTSQECYVDIGAYDGDTVGYFVKAVNGRFERIHAFELDPVNFRLLEQNVGKLPRPKHIKIYNLGVWDTECDISFSTGKSQSTVGSGENRGHVVPLDTILADQTVTFIKMDIEGAELHALRGAQRIIQRQGPKMAVCVYHHLSHLWEVPLYLRSLLPDHKLYLRHHTNLEYETVCYAIPPEQVD